MRKDLERIKKCETVKIDTVDSYFNFSSESKSSSNNKKINTSLKQIIEPNKIFNVEKNVSRFNMDHDVNNFKESLDFGEITSSTEKKNENNIPGVVKKTKYKKKKNSSNVKRADNHSTTKNRPILIKIPRSPNNISERNELLLRSKTTQLTTDGVNSGVSLIKFGKIRKNRILRNIKFFPIRKKKKRKIIETKNSIKNLKYFQRFAHQIRRDKTFRKIYDIIKVKDDFLNHLILQNDYLRPIKESNPQMIQNQLSKMIYNIFNKYIKKAKKKFPEYVTELMKKNNFSNLIKILSKKGSKSQNSLKDEQKEKKIFDVDDFEESDVISVSDKCFLKKKRDRKGYSQKELFIQRTRDPIPDKASVFEDFFDFIHEKMRNNIYIHVLIFFNLGIR